MCKKVYSAMVRWPENDGAIEHRLSSSYFRTFAPSSSLHLTIESSHRAIASSSLHHCATVIAASTEILLRWISWFHSFETVRSRRSKVLTGTVSVKDAANSGLHVTVTVIYQSGVPSGSVWQSIIREIKLRLITRSIIWILISYNNLLQQLSRYNITRYVMIN